MAETRLTTIFTKAGDYQVPLGTYMDKPKTLDSFLNDSAQWGKITGTQIISIPPAFAEKLFGNNGHDNYAGILFENYISEMRQPLDARDTKSAERDLKDFIPLFKKAAAEFYDAKTFAIIDQLPEENLIGFATSAKNMHELRYGVPDQQGKIFGSMGHYTSPAGEKFSFLAMGETKDISFENAFSKGFQKLPRENGKFSIRSRHHARLSSGT